LLEIQARIEAFLEQAPVMERTPVKAAGPAGSACA
jgi:hypothetical protein